MPDWKQGRPTDDEIGHMWQRLTVQHLPIQSTGVHEVMATARTERPRGGAEVVCLQLGPSPELDWFASHNRLDDIDFVSVFFTASSVTHALSELRLQEPLPSRKRRYCRTGWNSQSAFCLVGQWAMALHQGTTTFFQTEQSVSEQNERAAHMVKLADRMFEDLFERRYADLLVYHTPDPWTDWFRGLLDFTWVVLDRRTRRLWLLALTDTD